MLRSSCAREAWKLRAAVKLANADWRDLLVAASFADSVDAHKPWTLRQRLRLALNCLVRTDRSISAIETMPTIPLCCNLADQQGTLNLGRVDERLNNSYFRIVRPPTTVADWTGTVVSILALRVIELPVCGLYCPVCYCRCGNREVRGGTTLLASRN